MRLKRNDVKAFTLLECLVSLLVITSSLLVFDGLTRILVQDVNYQESNMQKDWLVFTDQLGRELEQSQFAKLENDRVYVVKDGQELAFGKSRADDFRKTDWAGKGYQPMLQQLRAVNIQQEGTLLRFNFSFANGMERTFLYDTENLR